MDKISVAIALTDRIAGWVQSLLEAKARRHAGWKEAVLALHDAVLKTQAYVAGGGRTKCVNRDVEAELVQAWQNASDKFYGMDPDLCIRLDMKAYYWTDPEAWTNEQVVTANISLQRLAEYMRQLLFEG